MALSLASVVVLVAVATTDVHCAHFRGGTFNWKPTGNGNEVELTYTMSFNGFPDARYPSDITPNHEICQSQDIRDSQTLLDTPGSMKCDGGNCDGWPLQYYTNEQRYSVVPWKCKDFSIGGGWDIGENTVTWTVPDADRTATIYFNRCCWVGPIQNVDPLHHQGWRMNTEIDLRPRADTGQINSSPVTEAIPVQLFHKGCKYHLEIPVNDPDDDAYRCRYTSNRDDECYDRGKGSNADTMCGELSYVTVFDNCTLLFDTTGPAGYYAVRVMIEDLDQSGTPLSKISLSFLLEVSPDDSTCETPVIISPEKGCKTIPVNKPYQMTVVAEAATDALPIVRIDTIKPPGMVQSELQDVPGHPLRKMITLSWTPTTDQAQEWRLGFNAIDSKGFVSSWSYVYLNVAEGEPLYVVQEENKPPAGTEITSTNGWEIKFNRRIRRPSQSAYITLIDESGNVVDQLDASREEQVEFRNKKVVFSVVLSPNIFGTHTYTLRVDEGVALDEEHGDCLLYSSPDEWELIVNAGEKPATRAPPTLRPITPPLFCTPYTNAKGEECYQCCPGDCDNGGPSSPGAPAGPPSFL